MKEIGGYFELERFEGSGYHKGLLELNSGRNALAYLLRTKKIRTLYLPVFLCDSVSNVCSREGCQVAYYPIDKAFLPVFDRPLEEDQWIYVVNFYGQISNEQVMQMKERWPRLIFDNVQAFFQKPLENVDTIYSCRKFFGVPDGAYLATEPAAELPQDVSCDRMRHILGRFEGAASEYYGDFKANDRNMVDLDVMQMSALTQNLLRAVDYESVRTKRNKNFETLHKVLGEHNPLPLSIPDGPYCYPFYCKNGMQIKQKLAQQKIYVATLWPNVLQTEGNALEKDYAENILPLPCDQRYTPEDMQRILCQLAELYPLR